MKEDKKGACCIRCGVEMESDAQVGLLCRQCAWEVDNENAEELMPVEV